MTDGDNIASLQQKAEKFQRVLEEDFFDDKGLMYSFINRDTRWPFTTEELKDLWQVRDFAEKPSPEDYWAYEDTPMACGSVLSAMSHRARVEGKSNALLERAYSALKLLSERCDREVEKGWLCKPWGGKVTRQTSNDQCAAVGLGLYDYAESGHAAEPERAREIILGIAEYWVRHNYTINYFGSIHSWAEHLPWAFVTTALVRLGFRLSGDKHLESETLRLVKECDTDAPFPRSGNYKRNEWPGQPWRAVRGPALYHHLVVDYLECMCDIWPEKAEQWRKCLAEFWEKDVNMGIDEDGLAFAAYEVDERTNAWKPLPPQFLPSYHRRKKAGEQMLSASMFWVSGYKMGDITAAIVCSAVKVGHCLPELAETCRSVARRSLGALDEDTLVRATHYDDRDPACIRNVHSRSLSSKSLAQWLCAYWQGRELGWWKETKRHE